MRIDSAAARFIVKSIDEPLTLIDVGCSGGIDQGWAVFGPKLIAFGFDPALAEINRLSQAEDRPGVRYVAAFVEAPSDHPSRQPQPGMPFQHRNPSDRLAWTRTTALRKAAETGEAPPPLAYPLPPALDKNLTSPPFSLVGAAGAPESPGSLDEAAMMRANEWHLTALADRARSIQLPQFLKAQGVSNVDFIKIDCDGPDFEILASLEETLAQAEVLALGLEVNFIGGQAVNHHTFHNTDRFMRSQGFDLAGLSVRGYASSALPFLYAGPYPHAAQNLGGRPYQGDAFYARDFGWADTRRLAGRYSDDKLLKQAAIMALFGRLDQAAELLIMFRARLSARLDIGKALDLLAQEIQDLQGSPFPEAPRARTYAEYMAAFEADAPSAYRGSSEPAAAPPPMAAGWRARLRRLLGGA